MTRYSQFPCVFSLAILGELEKYTFLESLDLTESKNQSFHLNRPLYGGHLGFSKWRPSLN